MENISFNYRILKNAQSKTTVWDFKTPVTKDTTPKPTDFLNLRPFPKTNYQESNQALPNEIYQKPSRSFQEHPIESLKIKEDFYKATDHDSYYEKPQTLKEQKEYYFADLGDYEESSSTLIEFIQSTLKDQYSMTEYKLPLEPQYKNNKKSNIFISENIENPKALLILIQGAGLVQAGIWSRSVCLKDNLDLGSMIPFVERANRNKWSTLILNPNLTERVPVLTSREEHGQYVWEQFVRKSSIPIFIVAHSYGGVSVIDLLENYWEDFCKRVKKIAFTDACVSCHSLRPDFKDFLVSHSIHWVASRSKGDCVLSKNSRSIEERSAGHIEHEYTTGTAFEYIFEYFECD